MQIPILNGIVADEKADYRTTYPRNMIPVPKSTGVSNGYLRPAEGITSVVQGPGLDRGSIVWDGINYRVMGTRLVSVNSDDTITDIGDVGSDNKDVSMDYSFDRLAIASAGKLYLYDKSTLVEVTDPDLGLVLDVIWVDGYFMTTDGESIVVTELTDPTAVDPLKYGSSEADPDPVWALKKLVNEPYALNRYTIEAFENVGGSGFPFSRIEGAQTNKGVLGTHNCCEFLDGIAMLGSGRDEPVSIWYAYAGSTDKLATREIDEVIAGYTEAQLLKTTVEQRQVKAHTFLYIHFVDQTFVYDHAASLAVKEPVWYQLTSSLEGISRYRARHMAWCYDKWIVGDTDSAYIGNLTHENGEHWGEQVGWEFLTQIVYNKSQRALIHELELVGLTGRAAYGDDPKIWTSYTTDGETFSQEHPIRVGKQGERNKRMVWLQQGIIENQRAQRFRGNSDARIAVARLEARIEALAW